MILPRFPEYSLYIICRRKYFVEIDLVFVTTRHNTHARLVIESLEANKHVFVEKPIALNNADLEEILKVNEQSDKSITVGFNRRFAPLAVKMKSLLLIFTHYE